MPGGATWEGLYFGFKRRKGCKKEHADSAA